LSQKSAEADRPPGTKRARRLTALREPSASILTAYKLEPSPAMPLLRAPVGRAWMNASPNRFAYRCLPLLIANQSGWLVLNPRPIRVVWDGTDAMQGLTIEPLGEGLPSVRSHFGSGILTWNLPYLFQTPSGYNLLVRGPANWPKDGACPLEGVVETDWSPATFTMNWKLTRPHLPVVFDKDEPICMILPQRRGELEAFRPRLRSLFRAPSLARLYGRWSAGRSVFLRELRKPGSEAERRGWQRDYLLGMLPDGTQHPDHQTKLRLKSFVDEADDE
jgi:hypothetical protein